MVAGVLESQLDPRVGRTNAGPTPASIVPVNHHPVRIGLDQDGGNPFVGELGRVSIFRQALPNPRFDFSNSDRKPLATRPELIFSGKSPGPVPESAGWSFAPGLTLEAWVKPEKLISGGARLVDKITPGGSDGFLLDTFPGNSLRFICGETPAAGRRAAGGPMDPRGRGGRYRRPAVAGCT
jgi:hypothetical protein